MSDQAYKSVNATLSTVIFFTTRMEELASFYGQALALGEPSSTGDSHLGFALPNVYLGFDQVEGSESRAGTRATLWFEVDDLDEVYERCLAAGATIRYAPQTKPWGGRLASLYDPDGNLFGLSQRVAAE